jgi:hypothetical protein
MIPLMPPPLALWGSPLYSELYVGLCRALAGPWLGGMRPATAAGPTDAGETSDNGAAAGSTGSGCRQAPEDGWRLFDSRQAEPEASGATSLAELCETVRELRTIADEVADASAQEIDLF